LDTALAAVATPGEIAMTVSGTGAFAVLMEARTQAEATWIGQLATAGMVLLLLVAYRRFGSLIASALPLVSAGLAGLATVSVLFGAVHGITLAFGFTLIGVAQDYPLHLLSHRNRDESPLAVARRLWPTLATGVASTCIAYLTFLFSGVTGLEQLACFTVSGLAVAGLTTRFLLPPLLHSGGRDFGDSALLGRLWHAIARLPRPRSAYLLLIVACAAAIGTARQPFWEDDLAKLTPVPEPLLARDQELRAQLGTADVRYLLVVAAADDAAALARLEDLDTALGDAVASGAIAGYDHAARYVPSAATQQRRQAKLPDSSTLRAALEAAQRDAPFRSGVFDPFLADVERARALPVLTVDRVRDTPLGARVDLLLARGTDGRTRALVTLSGVRDVGALRALAMAPGVTFLDLKSASETLVARERDRILLSLALAGVLLVAVVLVALRRRERVARVLAPMAVTTLLVVAALRASGISLNLFHLISLVLVAGLGLDYALFFEHAADDPAEQRRTLHAVLVCSASTFMVFALLAISSLPVLRAIGLPVSIGVVSNFVLALLLTRPRPAAAR
jgi:predicted exporter